MTSKHALDIKHLRMLRAVIANERLQLPANLKDDMERMLFRGICDRHCSQAHFAKRLSIFCCTRFSLGKGAPPRAARADRPQPHKRGAHDAKIHDV